MSLENNESKVIQGRFLLTKKLGAGSFGEIFEAKDLKTKKVYACKAESMRTKHPQLRLEYQIYRALQRSPHFVRVWGYVQHYNHQIMIMDKLGDSLEQLFTMCGRKFTIGCVCNIAIQILTRIEELHQHHYLHRDIKPDNFLIGQGDYTSEEAGKIYMIDLGLGKLWKENGRHIPEKHGKRLIGTPRYASIKTHFGHEQSRRDDLESLGYMLMYFVHGHLPWQGLRGQTKEEKYQKIGHKKRDTRLTELCRNYPDEFRQYLEKCQNLRFTEEPPYAEYRELFQKVLRRQPQTGRCFDWQSGKFRKNNGAGNTSSGNNKNAKLNNNNVGEYLNGNNNKINNMRGVANNGGNANGRRQRKRRVPPPNINPIPNATNQNRVLPPTTNAIQPINNQCYQPNTNQNSGNNNNLRRSNIRKNNLNTNNFINQQQPPQSTTIRRANNNYRQQQPNNTNNNPLSLPNLNSQQLVPINQVIPTNNYSSNNADFKNFQTRYNRCMQDFQLLQSNKTQNINTNTINRRLNTNNVAQLAAAANPIVNIYPNNQPSPQQQQQQQQRQQRYDLNNNYNPNRTSPLAINNKQNIAYNNNNNSNSRRHNELIRDYQTLLDGYKKLENERDRYKQNYHQQCDETTKWKNQCNRYRQKAEIQSQQLTQRDLDIQRLNSELWKYKNELARRSASNNIKLNNNNDLERPPNKKRRLNPNISRRLSNNRK